MTAPWAVPAEWVGETCFIIGGGASLRGFDAEALRGKGRVIALNEAGLAGEAGSADERPHAPWADCLYWADARWFNWNHKRFGEHVGKYKITRATPTKETGHDIKLLLQGIDDLSRDRLSLSGWDSGANAINLAYLFGAARIVLLGFDMQGGNWHDRHQQPGADARYASHFMPAIGKMAGPLRQAGVEVINCSLESKLTCFRKQPLEDVLMAIDDNLPEVPDVVVTPAGVPVEDGLHLCQAPQLPGVIAGLARYDRLVVEVRTIGPDVVTRRPAWWWQQRLALAFPVVIVDSVDGQTVTFDCRKHAAQETKGK